MNLSPRDRLIVTIVVAVVIIVALVGFLIYPQVQQLNKLNTEVAAATTEADAAKLKLQQRQSFKDRAVETSAKWLRLENQVPENPDLPSLIIELQDAAFKSGVQVVTITPAVPSVDEKATGVLKIPVAVEVLGTWADTIDYMEDFMRLDRGIRVVGFNSRPTSDATEESIRNSALHAYAVHTSIALEAYVIPNPSASATSAATN